jgi:serine/threonine-protein kinase
MAHVWAARHLETRSVFALKILMPHLAEMPTFREMFFDEARLASRIRHENVARTFELTTLDDRLTLVMEWVDGSSLVRLLSPNVDEEEKERTTTPLPLRHAAKIVAETCAGLHYAHDLVDESGRPLGVVHRDVSPHNVLLTRDGRVKVTDFGVAKALGKLHMTLDGQIKGKLAYMSPEQLGGGGVDRRSDVFSLGALLYETTVGRRPFRGDHDPQLMAAILAGQYAPPSSIVRGFPRELEAIVSRALSTDPAARFPTARALGRALERWLEKSGPPLGAAQISLLVHERCSSELRERQSALSITPPPPMSTAAGGPVEAVPAVVPTPRRMPPKQTGVSLTGAICAVLVGLVLGLVVLSHVQRMRTERRAALNAAVKAPSAVLDKIPPAPKGARRPQSSEPNAEVVPVDAPAATNDLELPASSKRKPKARPKATPSAIVMPPNPYQ